VERDKWEAGDGERKGETSGRLVREGYLFSPRRAVPPSDHLVH
jgi:hypothetical protein